MLHDCQRTTVKHGGGSMLCGEANLPQVKAHGKNGWHYKRGINGIKYVRGPNNCSLTR